MVHLVTRANSVSFLLFHVEHSEGDEWFCRWRIRGPYPPRYLEWRYLSTREARLVIQPEITACEVEVEWREHPEDPWSQAALHECATGTARFLVKALHDFASRESFRVMAEVGGMVACYCFSPLELHAGVETVVRGTADGPFPENVLLSPGEFSSGDVLVRFENLFPSEGSLVPCAPVDEWPVLTRIPGSAERRLWAIRPGGVPASQVNPPPILPDHG